MARPTAARRAKLWARKAFPIGPSALTGLKSTPVPRLGPLSHPEAGTAMNAGLSKATVAKETR